jgi:26S proteasome regulatory subunit N9
MQSGQSLVVLYNNFIGDFESKMNPLSLVQLAMVIVEQIKDPEESKAFVNKIGEIGSVKSNSEAFGLTRVLVGKTYLHQQQKQKETKAIIDEVEELLNDVDGVSPVHSHYYLLASDLYKIQGRHAEFYRSSLRYLGCTDISTLSTEEKQKNAFFLSLAALLGEGVYNFGELLAHPVLQTLKGTENEWLIDLLFAFNSGDVQKFRSVKNKWSTQADLAANENLLFEKVCLLCLMEMTFRREATQRQINFKEISEATTLPINQVELLVMKALSQGLVKGKIDQVGQVVHLTWVQARVLNTDQLKVMMTKINSWCTAVGDMERLIENKAGDILTF